MNLGAEPKKVMILGGLLAVAVVVYFINSSSTGDSGYKPSTARSGVGASAGRTPGIATPSDPPSAPYAPSCGTRIPALSKTEAGGSATGSDDDRSDVTPRCAREAAANKG